MLLACFYKKYLKKINEMIKTKLKEKYYPSHDIDIAEKFKVNYLSIELIIALFFYMPSTGICNARSLFSYLSVTWLGTNTT